MRTRAALLLLLVALAPCVHAQPIAGEPSASVRLAGALDEKVTVELVAGAVSLSFEAPDGRRVALGPGESTAYDVPVARSATLFVLVRLADVLPRGLARIETEAPEGWSSTASRGVAVFARDLRSESRVAGEARVRSVGVGPQGADEAAYLARGVAYLAAQHAGAPREILVIRAPSDLVPEGFVADDAVVLPDAAPVDELARLLARLHQRYRVVEVAPTSAAWFREGEERLHVELSRLAADLRTSAEVDEEFTRARAVADPSAPLTQAPGGSTLARQKGLVVVRALDVALRNATDGRAGLADLLERLDREPARLDSAGIEARAILVGGPSLAGFFERYVYGPEWPPTLGVRDASDVFVTALDVDPARAPVGEQVVVAYQVVNRGTRASDLDLVLTLDGEPAQIVPVRIDVGVRRNASTQLVATDPGDRVVGLGPLEAGFHVMTPGRLELARASTTPADVRAGEPFTLLVYVENFGEASARGHVEVYDGDRLVQRTTDALIEGRTTNALTLPMRLDAPGLHVLDIRLTADRGGGRLDHAIDVALSGVPTDDTRAPSLVALGGAMLLAWALVRRTRGSG